MKHSVLPALAAGLMLATAPLAAVPASAEAIKGIGIVDYNEIVAGSSAFQTAEQQRKVTYKAQFDQAERRNQEISAQLKPLIDKFNAGREAANPDRAALQNQVTQIQQIEEAGKAELQKILAPVTISRAYVAEQITDQLDTALRQAMARKKVSLILSPDGVVSAEKDYYMNDAVIAELNALLPVAQLVPPEGWLPRELRDQVAAMQAQQGGVAAPQPTAGPAPQSR